MGNDTSHLSGLKVNEKAIEITDFWAHYHANVNETGYVFNLKGSSSISVFKSETPVFGTLWTSQTPLEKCSMNLMKFRHPCMLRYIWHWQQKGVSYLTTECVQPLAQVLPEQDPVQICVGLNQIAQVLDFLHNNAKLSHNNINIGSIYVLPDGTWKLGNMEMAKPFSEISTTFLNQAKKHRYDKAIDPLEEQGDHFTAIDQYAYGQLVEDVFKGRTTDDLPYWQSFKEFCQKELKSPISSQRPNFSSVLKHNFFNHEFISIHNFFVSLPVKTEKEKCVFFDSLLEKLKNFNEEIVAKQLSSLLLSRLVLLDATARDKLIPYILVPKPADNTEELNLFSERVFKSYITPQLLKMFQVRDMQVRLLLLKYFSGFSSTFSKSDLTSHILPELLLGIKDTNDNLVSMTLYCLADLVPILGASTVIGGKRSKLFADGRPLSHSKINSEGLSHKIKQKRPVVLDKIEEDVTEVDRGLKNVNELHLEKLVYSKSECSFGSGNSIVSENSLFLHERPSPDGGEDLDIELQNNVGASDNGDEDQWSDWDTEENLKSDKDKSGVADLLLNNLNMDVPNDSETRHEDFAKKVKSSDSQLQQAAIDAKNKKLVDLSELDIKNQKFKTVNGASSSKDEFDFFLDMEPVIEKANVLKIEEQEEQISSKTSFSSAISAKLSFTPTESDESKVENDGWGDTVWDD